MKSKIPCTKAWLSRSSTVPWRQALGLFFLPFCPLMSIGEFDQTLGGVGPAVQEHVFHPLEKVGRDFLVHVQLSGIDDPHVHSARMAW